MQELLAKQKEIAEKFNAQQIEQDKLRQEFEKITAVIQDRQALAVPPEGSSLSLT